MNKINKKFEKLLKTFGRTPDTLKDSELSFKRFSKLMALFADKSLTLKEAIQLLTPWLDYLKELYETELVIEDRDYRSGKETYGYMGENQVLERLEYISDRWAVSFRVRWLINLIDCKYQCLQV